VIRPLRTGAGVAAGLLLLAVPIAAASPPAHTRSPASSPAHRPAQEQEGTASAVLVDQTPVVNPGESMEFRLRLDDVPANAFIQLEVHGRVGSRSEFLQSVEGDGLRSRISSASPIRIDELRRDPSGAVRVPLALDPRVPGGIPITLGGVYPVRLRVTDTSSATLASVVTHMVVADETDESPPLAVAVVADLRAPVATTPDGDVELRDGWLDRTSELLRTLTGVDGLPVSYAMTPETLDALANDGRDRAASLLGQLRAAAGAGSVLHLPYADVSVQSLVDAGMEDELARHLDRGRAVLSDELGVDPASATWLADPELGPSGAAVLRGLDVRHLVLRGDQVGPAPPAALSLASRFEVDLEAPDDDPDDGLADAIDDLVPTAPTPPDTKVGTTGVDALEVDEALTAHLGAGGPPALRAQRLLAELAVVWSEQPARPRGVVLIVDRTTRSDVLRGALRGLDARGVLEPVSIAEAFERTGRLTDPSGAPIIRTLVPEPAPDLPAAVVERVRSVRDRLAGYESLIGPESPRALPLQTQVLLATGDGLDDSTREAHLDQVDAEIDRVIAAIHLPDQPQVTLTAREASIPLTIENDAGFPFDVVVHLDSQRLDFPRGDRIAITLAEGTSRLDLDVRTLTTGAFPLDIRVTSPDERIELTGTRYRVRSTAVSGVGLLISIGAGVFLLLWWLSHWRRARRSRRLVPLDTVTSPAVE
jgi:hypothetical protein